MHLWLFDRSTFDSATAHTYKVNPHFILLQAQKSHPPKVRPPSVSITRIGTLHLSKAAELLIKASCPAAILLVTT